MIDLTPQETALFQRMAKSLDGIALTEFCDKLSSSLVDIRNIPNENLDVEKRARTLAVNIIKENFIDRLKVLSGDVAPPNTDDYE